MKMQLTILVLGTLAASVAQAHGTTCVTTSVCSRVVAQCRGHQLAEPRRWLFVATAAIQEEGQLACHNENGTAFTETEVRDEIPVSSGVWRNEADALDECAQTLALELGSRKACE